MFSTARRCAFVCLDCLSVWLFGRQACIHGSGCKCHREIGKLTNLVCFVRPEHLKRGDADLDKPNLP